MQTEADLAMLKQSCNEAVDLLLARHQWQLLDRDEFVRLAIESLRAGIASDAYRAAVHTYSHTLHIACSGAEGPQRQSIGYTELFRYLYDCAFRRYPDVCDDATQLALERIFALFDRCRQPGAFLAFALHQLMSAGRTLRRQEQPRSHSLDATRQADQNLLSEALPDRRQIDPLEHVIAVEQRSFFSRLAAEFHRKHPRAIQQFSALWLKYIDGLDDRAISQRLHTTVANVHVLRSRAIKKLRSEPHWRACAIELGLVTDDNAQG